MSKFDTQREAFENYGLNSLHQEFSFSEAAPVINARNQIVFGTDKGFIEISPKEMQKSMSDASDSGIFSGGQRLL